MKKLIIIAIICFLALITPTSAVAYVPVEWDGDYTNCTTSCVGDPPPGCANGPSVGDSGGCGLACNGGSVWSRYTPVCKNTAGPDQDETCSYFWERMGDSCSTANKCLDRETGLRPGYCSCGYGGMWKTCCSGTTPIACTQVDNDGIWPYEGTCAGGNQVDCGYEGYPPCGAEACIVAVGGAATATPVPGAPTATPTGTGAGATALRLFVKASAWALNAPATWVTSPWANS